MGSKASSQRVATLLQNAISTLHRTKTSFSQSEPKGLPKAFSVVASQLHTVHDALVSVKNSVTSRTSGREMQADSGSYNGIVKTSEKASKFSDELATLYGAVLETDHGPIERLNQYRSIANQNNRSLEQAMGSLIRSILEAPMISTVPLVGENERLQLEKALEQVKKAPASLEDERPTHSIINHDGNQNTHFGTGNISPFHGSGFQINGESQGATFTMAPAGT